VAKVLQRDSIIEMADPALLVTKEGSVLPIDDSSAPIKDESGSVVGVALVFRDITERRKAEKEKEELLKDKARGELSNFVLSALPVFASNIPPQVRNNIARSFADRFEKNMRPQFQEDLENCLVRTGQKREKDIFTCYTSWLSEFLKNLGISTETKLEKGFEHLKFINCPWIDAEASPMFCLICRAIVIRSFTWTDLKGSVDQTACMADNSDSCEFEFVFNYQTEID